MTTKLQTYLFIIMRRLPAGKKERKELEGDYQDGVGTERGISEATSGCLACHADMA
jgi:hypothetical protein